MPHKVEQPFFLLLLLWSGNEILVESQPGIDNGLSENLINDAADSVGARPRPQKWIIRGEVFLENQKRGQATAHPHGFTVGRGVKHHLQALGKLGLFDADQVLGHETEPPPIFGDHRSLAACLVPELYLADGHGSALLLLDVTKLGISEPHEPGEVGQGFGRGEPKIV